MVAPVIKVLYVVGGTAIAAGVANFFFQPFRQVKKPGNESAEQAALANTGKLPPFRRVIVSDDSPKITMDQNDKYIWIQFQIGEKNLEPEVSINLNENDGNILLIEIDNIQKSYQLKDTVKWPVYWVYSYENAILTLVLERVEPIKLVGQYWTGLDEYLEKSTDQQSITDNKQNSVVEYQMSVNNFVTLVDNPHVFYMNVQFDLDHSIHSYANYPLGTYYKVNLTVPDGKKLSYKLFPIPRELLDERINNKETLLKVRNEVIRTDEQQRLYVENGSLGGNKELTDADSNGKTTLEFERAPTMLLNNRRDVTMKDAILKMPEGYRIVFIAASCGVTTFLEPMLYLCLNTDRIIKLVYINVLAQYSIFHDELNKLVEICDGRLEVHRLHPNKDGISDEEEKKRYRKGALRMSGATEITSNLVKYKNTQKTPEDTIFISATIKNANEFKKFLIKDYGYKEDNIYSFSMNASLVVQPKKQK